MAKQWTNKWNEIRAVRPAGIDQHGVYLFALGKP